MPTIKLDDIQISEERQRQDKGTDEELGALAGSIQKHGLLHPVILDENNVLIAGERRIMAHRLLGLEEIEYKSKEGLTDYEREEIELEENLRRKNLTWVEETEAITRIDRLRSAQDPTWNREKTAAMIGKSKSTVYNALALQEAIKNDPTLGDAKNLVAALKQHEKKQHMKEREKRVKLKQAGLMTAREAKIVTGDALELIQGLEAESVDAIVTNPPFGVNLEFQGMGEIYHDDEDYITDLIRSLAPEWYRVLKPDSWLVSFFDLRKITYSKYQRELAELVLAGKPGEDVRRLAERSLGLVGWLEHAGFSYVTAMPLMWAKPNKTVGTIGNPDRGFIVAYEALVFAAKGDAKLVRQGKSNVFIYDTPPASERVHPLQMPVDLCTELVDMVTVSGELVLDTFAGSGAIGLGALNNQCEFLGFELDPDLARNGNTLLGEHDLAKEAEKVVVRPDGKIFMGAKQIGQAS